MSVANISASCVATGSGMRASSVAANSELRMVPLPRRTWDASGAVSTIAMNLSSKRVTRRREKWVPAWSGFSAG